jgi:hypothetical protein
MIAAALGALAMLIGVVAPFEGRALQTQRGHGYALSVLDPPGWHGNGDDTSRMERLLFPNFFVGNTKNKINCRIFSSIFSIKTQNITFKGQPFAFVGGGLYFYSVGSSWEYNIIPRVLEEIFPLITRFTLADRFEGITSQSVLDKEPRFKLCFSPNRNRRSVPGIFNFKPNIYREAPSSLVNGPLRVGTT